MEIKTVIIDDEKPARSRMKRMLSKYKNIIIAGEAQNGIEGLELIGRIKPDAVFLDIKMPLLSGFEMLNKLDNHPYIIFTTAYDKYALRAFEENTVDYLLKPVSDKNLERAVSKINKILVEGSPAGFDLGKILNSIKKERDIIRRFSVRLGQKILLVPAEEICFFNAESKLTFLNTAEKDYVIPFTIKELESRLDPDKFLRIHRAYIVNIESIKSIHTWFGGRLLLKLKNKKEINVSRSYVNEFRKKINMRS